MTTNHWLKKRCPVCREAKLEKSIHHYEDGYTFDTIFCCNHCNKFRSQHYIYPQSDYWIDGQHLMWSSATPEAEKEMNRKISEAIKKARDKYLKEQSCL